MPKDAKAEATTDLSSIHGRAQAAFACLKCSQDAFAKKIRMSRQGMRKYLDGERTWSPEMVKAFSAALKIKEEWLRDGNNPPDWATRLAASSIKPQILTESPGPGPGPLVASEMLEAGVESFDTHKIQHVLGSYVLPLGMAQACQLLAVLRKVMDGSVISEDDIPQESLKTIIASLENNLGDLSDKMRALESVATPVSFLPPEAIDAIKKINDQIKIPESESELIDFIFECFLNKYGQKDAPGVFVAIILKKLS